MGLNIYVTLGSDVICPHCGKVVMTTDEGVEEGSGRGWYPILEDLGYYVPYEKRTEENDWYGKDMVLTEEQTEKLYKFVKKNPDLYGSYSIRNLIATAMIEEKTVVINADW